MIVPRLKQSTTMTSQPGELPDPSHTGENKLPGSQPMKERSVRMSPSELAELHALARARGRALEVLMGVRVCEDRFSAQRNTVQGPNLGNGSSSLGARGEGGVDDTS